MDKQRLGDTGLVVSRFGFGATTFGGTGMLRAVGSTQAGAARRMIDRCLEEG